MSYDEQPDGDPHGECAAEIDSLKSALMSAQHEAATIREVNARLCEQVSALKAEAEVYRNAGNASFALDAARDSLLTFPVDYVAREFALNRIAEAEEHFAALTVECEAAAEYVQCLAMHDLDPERMAAWRAYVPYFTKRSAK